MVNETHYKCFFCPSNSYHGAIQCGANIMSFALSMLSDRPSSGQVYVTPAVSTLTVIAE